MTTTDSDMRYAEVYDSSPVLLLVVDERMALVHCSRTLVSLLQDKELRTLYDILESDSALDMTGLLDTLATGDAPVRRDIRIALPDGTALALPCLADKLDGGHPARSLLRITALYDPDGLRITAGLLKSVDLLRDIMETATEAMWCIEFSEPVEVGAATQEVVRQVFTNECHWMMCNKAMARLYDLPEGLDFEKQAVSLYFQHNAENETFVRQIIESGYCIDNAPSVDVRHDGSTVYVENTVRAHIVDGRLIRLWGSVRDVTGYRQRQNRLQQQVENVHNVLGAIPYALLVIDRNRTLLGINPAFERHFEWRAEQLLGRDIQCLLDLENGLPGGRQWYGCDRQQWIATIRTPSGREVRSEALLSPVGEEAPHQFVLTLCPLAASATGSGEGAA